jgi:hypothetical protein
LAQLPAAQALCRRLDGNKFGRLYTELSPQNWALS